MAHGNGDPGDRMRGSELDSAFVEHARTLLQCIEGAFRPDQVLPAEDRGAEQYVWERHMAHVDAPDIVLSKIDTFQLLKARGVLGLLGVHKKQHTHTNYRLVHLSDWQTLTGVEGELAVTTYDYMVDLSVDQQPHYRLAAANERHQLVDLQQEVVDNERGEDSVARARVDALNQEIEMGVHTASYDEQQGFLKALDELLTYKEHQSRVL